MIFVSPAEPAEFKTLGMVSPLTETYGSDFLITGFGFLVAVQRKQFPGDFVSSMHDGRFATLLPKMLQADMRVLILEGRPKWSGNGALVGYDYGGAKEFTRTALRSIRHSLQHLWGVSIEWCDDKIDTADCIKDLDRWANKEKHDGLGSRPGLPGQHLFNRKPKPRDLAVYFLAGLPGIGPELAGRIYDHFGRVPMEFDVTRAELEAIHGIGKVKIEAAISMGLKLAAEDRYEEFMKRYEEEHANG